jgi:phosphate starvation-inducible PhoH-like protein
MAKRSVVKMSAYKKEEFADKKGPEIYGLSNWTLSEEQQELSEIIDSSDCVFVSGKAGTGKTAGVLHNFVKTYLKDKSKKIVVIRCAVEAGMDKIGFLPGGVGEKLEPHFASSKAILEDLLSKNKLECDIDKRIKFVIPNFILGSTFDDSLILVDEAQQLSPEIIKLILERVGTNSKVVLCGDPSQIYTSTGKRNGLATTIKIFQSHPVSGIDFFTFSVYNNMRSDFVARINQVYESTGLM